VVGGNTYAYRVMAVNGAGVSAYSNTAIQALLLPAAPSGLTAVAFRQGIGSRVRLTWIDHATNETGFTIQRATDPNFTIGLTTNTVGANVTTYTTGNLSRNTNYYFRIRATNISGSSAWVNATPSPILTP